MCADDLTVQIVEKDPKLATQTIQKAITSLSIWVQKWSIKISYKKLNVVYSQQSTLLKKKNQKFFCLENIITPNSQPKILGVILDEKLIWRKDVETVTDKCLKGINLIKAVILGRRYNHFETTTH